MADKVRFGIIGCGVIGPWHARAIEACKDAELVAIADVKIEKAKALINLKKTEREVLIQIKDSVRDCNILGKRLNKQKIVVKLQEEKLAAELKRYQYGRSDTDTIIRYQDDLLSSKLLYTQALLDYQEALIELALKENSLLDRFWKDTL